MFDSADALLLARFQFAFTVSFHFLFPAFTIGLASYLAVLEGLWLKTGKTLYLDLFRYWVKIFAVNFAMGVVSGIVLSYQFGTNWSVFSDKAGPVIGPLMAYEVLTAFFLEAGFLGVMLFGMNKVGRGLHFAAHHGASGRCGGRPALAARQRPSACAQDVLHGDVDGRARRADPGFPRRPARTQHAAPPAGQSHGDGRPL